MDRKQLILTDTYELWRSLFHDEASVVPYPYKGFRKGTLGFLFYRITHSKRLGCPFIRLWNKRVISKWGKIKENDILIVMNPAIWSWYMHIDMIEELKKRNVKLVLLIVDSMRTMRREFSEKIEAYAPYFDLIYTFDIADAKKYGWKHSYSYYSKIQPVQPMGEKTDVLCILYNSGRILKVTQIWDILQKKNLKCYFAVNGVSEEEKKTYYREGIVYNKQYSYEEIIGYVLQTKVILEVTQDYQSGCTLRAFEATVYGKRLLTNSSEINSFPFYNHRYMRSFSDVNDIDAMETDFFTIDEIANYNYNGELSPKHLYNQIYEYFGQ